MSIVADMRTARAKIAHLNPHYRLRRDSNRKGARYVVSYDTRDIYKADTLPQLLEDIRADSTSTFWEMQYERNFFPARTCA